MWSRSETKFLTNISFQIDKVLEYWVWLFKYISVLTDKTFYALFKIAQYSQFCTGISRSMNDIRILINQKAHLAFSLNNCYILYTYYLLDNKYKSYVLKGILDI